MLTRTQKKQVIENLTDKFSKMKSGILVDFTGLSVSQISKLRQQLKKEEAELKMAKKSLVSLALKKKDLKIDLEQFKGQVAWAFGYQNELAVVKILTQFAKENKNLKMLAGIVAKDYFDAADLKFLAQLPSRDELLARLINRIASPLSGLMNVLQGNLRNLVFVLSQIKK